MIGQALGHYRITAKLGEGGMGVVYRAHDSRLGRYVAIKVLPEAFARDPERMARFEREARTLASLNHPNIAMLHGLEQGRCDRGNRPCSSIRLCPQRLKPRSCIGLMQR